ncbi:MAG: ATP-binding protein [Acidobacteriota bacterium]|nr:ATP-binding protein [Acidobacteriota bacterium]
MSQEVTPTPSGSASPEEARCPICGGTGWHMVQVEHRGRMVEQASRCDCIRSHHGERLLESARIPRRYRHCELSNFDHDGQLFRSLASAYLASMRFVEEYPMETAGLLLTGPIGSGKTHLAVGIIKELITQKNANCLFYDYRELLKEIQNSYNNSVPATEMEVLRPVFQAEVLVLDELGAAKPTEWVWDTVSHILNTRYNDKRTTIITTNFKDLAPGELDSRASRAAREETLGDRIGERMRSRLHEMCRVVQVEGDDYRMKYKSASLR